MYQMVYWFVILWLILEKHIEINKKLFQNTNKINIKLTKFVK